MKLTIPALESAFSGLAAALPPADATAAACAAVVFGSGRLIPSYADAYGPAWYGSLAKPAWTPPNLAFPVVWTSLKLLQAAGMARLVAAASAAAWAPPSLLPLGAWAVHTSLGLLWNVTHFGRRDLPGSVKVMAGVWASSLATAAAWWRADPAAGKFFAPTCVWLTVAAALNVSIARLNRKKGE
jgi:tryptophan-rich sensory protein